MALEGATKATRKGADSLERFYQSVTGPLRGTAGRIFWPALIVAGVGPIAALYKYDHYALPQVRNAYEKADDRGEAIAALHKRLDAGETTFGDMPGTVLDDQQIAGAEDIQLYADISVMSIYALVACLGLTTKTEKPMVVAFAAGHLATQYFYDKPLSSLISEFIT